MNLSLTPSRSGPPTLILKDKYIHSPYDPLHEAQRFVRALDIPENTDFIILLEPGLGYIIPFLRETFPYIKLLVIHISDFYISCPHTYDREGTRVWYPSSDVDVISFLEHEIPEGAQTYLCIWKPSEVAFGSAYQALLSKIKQFLDRETANNRTTKAFGKTWLKNSFKNLAYLQNPIFFEPGSIPCIVAGAGPSLEDAIPLIVKALQQGPLLIVAAASAVPALLERHIIPTLSVATDGGTWAAFHLFDQLRRVRQIFKQQSSPLPFSLAVMLYAKTCSQAAQVPQIIISDGSQWQQRFLAMLGIPFLQLPQRGTVSATLIDLALFLTKGKIYITGMDMGIRDIQTHARPYGLDFYLEERVNHLSPLYNVKFTRLHNGANTQALDVYAHWFDWYFAKNRDRISVLGSKHPRFPMLPASENIYWDSSAEPAFYRMPSKIPIEQYSPTSLVSLFCSNILHSEDNEQIGQELSYLITGRRMHLTVPEIEKELAELFT